MGDLDTPAAADAGDDRQAAPGIAPWAGAPGTEVEVEMSGLPAGATLWVGAGALGAEQEILEEVETDAEGTLATTVRIPEWARAGGELFFFVSDTDSQPMAVSGAFHVTGEDGTFRVEGRITGTGECPVLRSDSDETYALEEVAGPLERGDRVVVEGTAAEDPRCASGRSIDVRRIERR